MRKKKNKKTRTNSLGNTFENISLNKERVQGSGDGGRAGG